MFTPPILARSGIGPADEVSALGIPLLQGLPVGRNLPIMTIAEHMVAKLRHGDVRKSAPAGKF